MTQWDHEADTLLAEADLGDQASAFFESELGKYIIGIAAQEIASYRDQLEDTSPTATDIIMNIQMEIRARRASIEWMASAIEKGHDALLNLELSESEDL